MHCFLILSFLAKMTEAEQRIATQDRRETCDYFVSAGWYYHDHRSLSVRFTPLKRLLMADMMCPSHPSYVLNMASVPAFRPAGASEIETGDD
jgi:hypothetical protein